MYVLRLPVLSETVMLNSLRLLSSVLTETPKWGATYFQDLYTSLSRLISAAETSHGHPSPVYVGSAEGKKHGRFEFNTKSRLFILILRMLVWIEWSSSKSLLIFMVKVSDIFNYSHLLSNILSTLRESSRRLDKYSKRFRLLLWRWRVAWSTNTGSSVKNYSQVSTCSAAIVMREKYMHVPQKICACRYAQLSTRKHLTCWKYNL